MPDHGEHGNAGEHWRTTINEADKEGILQCIWMSWVVTGVRNQSTIG